MNEDICPPRVCVCVCVCVCTCVCVWGGGVKADIWPFIHSSFSKTERGHEAAFNLHTHTHAPPPHTNTHTHTHAKRTQSTKGINCAQHTRDTTEIWVAYGNSTWHASTHRIRTLHERYTLAYCEEKLTLKPRGGQNICVRAKKVRKRPEANCPVAFTAGV